ncbi:MAG: thiamine pyrophosphate-dependent dehydrogenase E1 component subunit alpha [Myxococcales bacterium]|nr:thiamine pyrophosphate-dependent dehydrogenase E1 component subunit alpha [Myxococcales bacterium]
MTDGEPLLQILDEHGNLVGDIPEPLTNDDLVMLYRHMRRIRVVDERMLPLQRQGRISFYGAATGQEAAVVGSGYALSPDDWVFPALREGGVALMRGYDLWLYIAQLFGNITDVTHGRQMPCHYTSRRHHFVSLSSPIGTQLPQAVGTAMGMRIRGETKATAVYMGDGATSEGDFHIALRFASRYQAPVVFFCQNNQWAISVPSSKQTRATSFAIKGTAYGIPWERVDGNCVLAVFAATQRAVQRAYAGLGPSFVEALTYRIGAHSTSDDPSRYRDESVTEAWKSRCPLIRFRTFLTTRNLWNEDKERNFVTELETAIKQAVHEHEAASPPPLSSMFTDVYAKLPAHIVEQQQMAQNFAATKPRGHRS